MKIISLISIAVFLGACIPDVYLIDRQTVLEQQASGDWLELDKVFYESSLKKGPVNLRDSTKSVEDRAIYQLTHSDKVDDK